MPAPDPFGDVPVAELERFGLNVRFVEPIECYWGIYVRDLQGVTPEVFCEKKQLGPKALDQLVTALQLLKESLKCH